MEHLLNINLMRRASIESMSTLKALANSDRLLLLCQLSQGEKSVRELELLLGIMQPTLSQQLGVLRSEGLVTTRRDSKKIYYSVSNEKVIVILNTLYKLYCN